VDECEPLALGTLHAAKAVVLVGPDAQCTGARHVIHKQFVTQCVRCSPRHPPDTQCTGARHVIHHIVHRCNACLGHPPCFKPRFFSSTPRHHMMNLFIYGHLTLGLGGAAVRSPKSVRAPPTAIRGHRGGPVVGRERRPCALHLLNPRFLIYLIPCDVASIICRTHVIHHIVDPRFLSQVLLCDVASIIQQCLPRRRSPPFRPSFPEFSANL
jgi:hypothetical protein